MLKEFPKLTRDIANRVISIGLLLTPGMPYHPDQFFSTNLGQKFNLEGKCSLGNQTILSFTFRDDPSRRRSIVIGISDGKTEIFGHYAGSTTGPARMADDLTGKIKDLEGGEIEISEGHDYQVNVYPATSQMPDDEILKISKLRTDTAAFAFKTVTVPVCTSFR
jgi:hypothetical protein